IYDPSLNTWTDGPSMTYSRCQHTATVLASGKVLVVGGFGSYDFGGISRYTVPYAEVYDPVANTWTLTPIMVAARADPTATLLSTGKVLVAGGYNPYLASGYLSSSELYDPAANTWTSTAGSMTAAREGA